MALRERAVLRRTMCVARPVVLNHRLFARMSAQMPASENEPEHEPFSAHVEDRMSSVQHQTRLSLGVFLKLSLPIVAIVV